MNELSREDIRHLSQLSRLELTEEEYGRYAGQLTAVVDYINRLQEVDTSKIEAHLGVTGLSNILAEDLPRSPENLTAIEPMAVISAAPRSRGRLIEVRAVLGEEVGAA